MPARLRYQREDLFQWRRHRRGNIKAPTIVTFGSTEMNYSAARFFRSWHGIVIEEIIVPAAAFRPQLPDLRRFSCRAQLLLASFAAGNPLARLAVTALISLCSGRLRSKGNGSEVSFRWQTRSGVEKSPKAKSRTGTESRRRMRKMRHRMETC